MKNDPQSAHSNRTLKSIAIYEAAKGLLVIVVGAGLLADLHRDFQELGENIVRHLGLNPAHHYPQIFLHAMNDLSPQRIKLLALGAACYSAFRFVEAWGLWFARNWAENVALISCVMYLPLEFYHLIKHFSWSKTIITGINLLMVAYFVQLKRKKARSGEGFL